ncbi:forkhead box Q2 [Megalops cyprinoides]|uniref:forkhead box Q2 n=1 Tax=Megalops cyprinoides TaxID=118141 RepID=UPI0018647474|nr:forkhead box Q2 [Megalops cyprinoides]
MDVTDSSSGRERLGIRFTIDYLLFNKGSSTLREDHEAQSPTADPMPHCIKGEQRQGTLSDRDSPELHGQEKEAEGSEEEHEEEPGKGEGREGDSSSENPQDKPTQSYIALISMAILASEEKKLLLCDIYQWIMDHYPYFKSKDKNWRNSVRHNLSLNECFVKAGRSDNGKGHFWAIHPANIQDFSKGDYQRRRARRRIRRAAGQLPYSLPPLHHPIHRLRSAPFWGFPPDHRLPCIPARMWWNWASLPAAHTPPFLSIL